MWVGKRPASGAILERDTISNVNENLRVKKMLVRDVKDFRHTAHCVAVSLIRSNDSGRTFGSIRAANAAVSGQFGLAPFLKLGWQHRRSSEEGRCSSTLLLALTEWKFFHLSNSRMVTWIRKCHQSLRWQNSEQWMGKRITFVRIISLSKMLKWLSYFKWRSSTRILCFRCCSSTLLQSPTVHFTILSVNLAISSAAATTVVRGQMQIIRWSTAN